VFEKRYLDQVKILLNILPLINRYNEFAIKGGTAINFFIFQVPRLSVDIDLCYLPLQSREETFKQINKIMSSLKEDIEKRFPEYTVNKSKSKNANVYKLIVSDMSAPLKIEPNELLRGSVKKPLRMNIDKEIARTFNLYPEGQILDIPDLFGGKICAALDRQHPRDLFDVHMMFRDNLFSDEVRKVFLVYLIQSNRPIAELLDPTRTDFSKIFENEFKGMVKEKISLDSLIKTRERLIDSIKRDLTKDEKEFLLSIKSGEPAWEKLGIGNFSHFPGVRWKIFNIKKMIKAKRVEAYKKLEKVLFSA
jgi:predicted nucleotidyltransferase component of viral defense system